MAEVNAVPYNGHHVVSLFSGGGGSSLGLRMAGFQALYANEFVDRAREVYAANFPTTFVDPRDIRTITPESIMEHAGIEQGELDLLEGSPPCASFSPAGLVDKAWGEEKVYSSTTQRTDDLFWEFARIVEGLRPRMFVAENVAGLLRGKAKGYFKRIYKHLQSRGYAVSSKVLDAMWFDAATTRKRIFFIGVRADLYNKYSISPSDAFPQRNEYYYSTRDVLPHVRRVNKGGHGKWTKPYDPCPTIVQGGARRVMSSQFSGATFVELLDGTKRKFTAPELARISGFPPDFVLTGSIHKQWERIGRAVPPPLMKAIGLSIADVLDQMT